MTCLARFCIKLNKHFWIKYVNQTTSRQHFWKYLSLWLLWYNMYFLMNYYPIRLYGYISFKFFISFRWIFFYLNAVWWRVTLIKWSDLVYISNWIIHFTTIKLMNCKHNKMSTWHKKPFFCQNVDIGILYYDL